MSPGATHRSSLGPGTGTPQYSRSTVGSPQAAVDWASVVRFGNPPTSFGSRTMTSAHAGLLASGGGGVMLTMGEQPASTVAAAATSRALTRRRIPSNLPAASG